MRLRGLYAITPDDADSARLVARARAALEGSDAGGWAALQYRNKLASPALRPEEARALATLARARGIPFIVNDDLELALEIGANGVHLGREDCDLAAARGRIPGKLLGASCYGSLPLARAAVQAGADYVAFGSVFPSVPSPERCARRSRCFARRGRWACLWWRSAASRLKTPPKRFGQVQMRSR